MLKNNRYSLCACTCKKTNYDKRKLHDINLKKYKQIFLITINVIFTEHTFLSSYHLFLNSKINVYQLRIESHIKENDIFVSYLEIILAISIYFMTL